jgi:nitrous oxidase accessory protein NosD
MKHTLLIVLLFMALAPAALASSTWYVDGVNGSDSNNCKTHQHACKTIVHAISLASSGDSILVAAATYTENLTIGLNLKVIGSGAPTTIIDGGGVGRVVTIPTGTHVTLSKLTIRNGASGGKFAFGGGIFNGGTLIDQQQQHQREPCSGDCVRVWRRYLQLGDADDQQEHGQREYC